MSCVICMNPIRYQVDEHGGIIREGDEPVALNNPDANRNPFREWWQSNRNTRLGRSLRRVGEHFTAFFNGGVEL